MNIALSILALALQATPPPPPPVLATPAPSPAASAAPSPSAGPGVLVASPAAADLHPSQSQALTVANATGTIGAQLDTPVATLSVDQTSRTVTLSASTQTGRATLTITDASGASVQVPVRVAMDAGVVPSTLTLRVTGNTVDPAWLQTQVQKIVTQSAQLQSGATMQLSPFGVPGSFAPGSTASVPVPIHIAGGDQYYDVDATPAVAVTNVEAPPFVPGLLFYDDDPEKIVADGVLYRNDVTASTPAVLYFYHQNSGDRRRMLVVLRATQAPASVQLIDASAGPNADVMTVGHNVSRDFLLQKPQNEGVVVDVNPGTPYVADRFDMQNLDGAAGSIGVHVLSGSSVQVSVVAVPESVTDAEVSSYLDQTPLPGDGHRRAGAFRIDQYGNEMLAYSAGGADANTQYGANTPPPADASAGHDYGDYGVLRTLTFDLSNPTPQAATVYLYERPMGGVVRSSFLVNGSLVQVGCARLPERYQIGQPFSLPPGSNSRIVVQTMTDGGSNYPLEVGVTASPPLPSTPAMFSADGCFPKAS